jgi:hypothetical protein
LYETWHFVALEMQIFGTYEQEAKGSIGPTRKGGEEA